MDNTGTRNEDAMTPDPITIESSPPSQDFSETTGAHQVDVNDERALDEFEAALPPWTRQLLECLTHRQREAFVLCEAGLTLDDVAVQMGISRGRVGQLRSAATEAMTEAAHRGVLRERHVPTVVPHARPLCSGEQCQVPIGMQAALALPIDALKLNVRAYNCLERAGIKSIGDLVSWSESDLLKLRSMGRKTLREVRAELATIGLHLAMVGRFPDGG